MANSQENLKYISKSKKATFDSCPLSFKFKYLDKKPEADNPYFIIGIDVHDFIDNFFKVVSAESDGLKNINCLKLHPNTEYKKNVMRFELERWEKISKAGFDKTFFYPVLSEKRFIVDNPKLIGVVDRVHKCCKADPFSSPDPEFKENDLVIVENKTGASADSKAKKYYEDLLWYRIIIEIHNPELIPIKWGAVYFPKDNKVYHYRLEIKDCIELAKSINTARDNITKRLESGSWEATPSKSACNWCQYRKYCEAKI